MFREKMQDCFGDISVNLIYQWLLQYKLQVYTLFQKFIKMEWIYYSLVKNSFMNCE